MNKEIVISENVESNKKMICPVGTHNAVCVDVEDLGLQRGYEENEIVRKVVMVFETPNTIAGKFAGKPHKLGKIFSVFFTEKSLLVKNLTDWYGYNPISVSEGRKSFRFNDVIGRPAIINVIHQHKGDKITPVITGVSMHIKGLDILKPSPTSAEPLPWIKDKQAQRLDKIEPSTAVHCDSTAQPSASPAQVPPSPVVKDSFSQKATIDDEINMILAGF